MARGRRSVPAEKPTTATDRPTVTRPASELSPEELHARLHSLRPREDDAHATKPLASYLTFWIAGEEYALPLARAREIVRCESITKVPDTPAWLRGVTNIRGSVVPVVDLAPRLRCAETPVGRRTAILLIEVDWTGDCMVMGLLVEAVGRVASMALEEIETTPPFGTRIRGDLVSGLIPVNGRFALILNADSALSANELLPRAGSTEKAADGAGIPSEDRENVGP